MKKLLPFLFLFSAPVYADIKQEFVTSAQITVDMPYVVTNKVGTTYSLSGNNITQSRFCPLSSSGLLFSPFRCANTPLQDEFYVH